MLVRVLLLIMPGEHGSENSSRGSAPFRRVRRLCELPRQVTPCAARSGRSQFRLSIPLPCGDLVFPGMTPGFGNPVDGRAAWRGAAEMPDPCRVRPFPQKRESSSRNCCHGVSAVPARQSASGPCADFTRRPVVPGRPAELPDRANRAGEWADRRANRAGSGQPGRLLQQRRREGGRIAGRPRRPHRGAAALPRLWATGQRRNQAAAAAGGDVAAGPREARLHCAVGVHGAAGGGADQRRKKCSRCPCRTRRSHSRNAFGSRRCPTKYRPKRSTSRAPILRIPGWESR